MTNNIFAYWVLVNLDTQDYPATPLINSQGITQNKGITYLAGTQRIPNENNDRSFVYVPDLDDFMSVAAIDIVGRIRSVQFKTKPELYELLHYSNPLRRHRRGSY